MYYEQTHFSGQYIFSSNSTIHSIITYYFFQYQFILHEGNL